MHWTPGPWEVLDDDVPFKVGIVHEDHALTPVAYDIQEQGDALLIAAAPELFDALKLLLRECGGSDDVRILAEAAIAKAEGR